MIAKMIVEFTAFVECQMSGKGSNLVGSLLKILIKLGFCEVRLQTLGGLTEDTLRMMDNSVEENLCVGGTFANVARNLLQLLKQIIEVNGYNN